MSEKEKEHGILRAHDLAGSCVVLEKLLCLGLGLGARLNEMNF